ncbi:MAG: hypothetical protein KDD70_07175 [Bdellovibrionales bacterium]|nr:hypothetical protein [Bdellovibrionales bacterium]
MKKRKTSSRDRLDPKKEKCIQALISIVEDAGYPVRRERLKRGSQWSAHSGVCTLNEQTVVFVDRTVSQDDQIDFLVSLASQLRIEVDNLALGSLPPALQKLLVPVPPSVGPQREVTVAEQVEAAAAGSC